MEIVGYGINIAYKSVPFERVATFDDENIAKEFYNLLLISWENKIGAKIELERIYECSDGYGYEYEVILKNYL